MFTDYDYTCADEIADRRAEARREAAIDEYYDRIANGECVCRVSKGDRYEPAGIVAENPDCPIHGDDADDEAGGW